MAKVTGEAIWLDGEFVAWDAARVHVLTHTLHYGLGVFEGIRCYQTADGRSAVFRLGEHLRRLYDSAHINLMKIPFERAKHRAGVSRDAAPQPPAGGLPAPARVHRRRRDGAQPGRQRDPRRDHRVGVGQVSRRRGHRARHPRQDLHVSAATS